jgi:hypothetical protein
MVLDFAPVCIQGNRLFTQGVASLTTSQLVEEASFWLLQQFDENLFLESFPPGDDDRSLVSFPDSLADKEDFFYQTSDHRYPEMISTPNAQ